MCFTSENAPDENAQSIDPALTQCGWEIVAVDPDSSGNSLVWEFERALSYEDITLMSGNDYWVAVNTMVSDTHLPSETEGEGAFVKMSLGGSGATALLASGASLLAALFF